MYEEPPHSRNIANENTEELKVSKEDKNINSDLKLS
jgi:hypothetical protein